MIWFSAMVIIIDEVVKFFSRRLMSQGLLDHQRQPGKRKKVHAYAPFSRGIISAYHDDVDPLLTTSDEGGYKQV